jgi:hypothetical protein
MTALISSHTAVGSYWNVYPATTVEALLPEKANNLYTSITVFKAKLRNQIVNQK